MKNRILKSLVHVPVCWAASLIRRVRINRVTFETISENRVVCKKRYPLSWLLILPGNLLFRWRKVPVRILYTNEWKHWERSIAPFDLDGYVHSSRTLVLERLDGVPLIAVLADTNRSDDQKFESVTLAAEALHIFHQQACEVPNRSCRVDRLSHGDATARNVMIDFRSKTATWFDFDLRHDMTAPPAERHADDLRAMLFSAAHFFPENRLNELVRTVKYCVADEQVWNKLSDQINSPSFALDFFHFAHTKPPLTLQRGYWNCIARSKHRLLTRIIRQCCLKPENH